MVHLTFKILHKLRSRKTSKIRLEIFKFRDVRVCFRVCMIAQMKEEKIRNKMVVLVLQGGRRSGGGGRIIEPAARV